MIQFGASIRDITPDKVGMAMLGWGKFENIAHGVGLPIKTRTFVFKDETTDKKVAFVCAEIAFVTQSLKQGVVKELTETYSELGFNEQNIMISATHTHSAPGGYSHYILYNLTSKGYIEEVYQKYVSEIVNSIVEANNNLKNARVCFSKGEIPLDEQVAFNRSLPAYQKNPEGRHVKNPAKAVDRNIYLIKAFDESGLPLGMLNWFAVHCTSVHSDNLLIHPDNKGCASIEFEKEFKNTNSNFVGAFAQSHCGDVTPNFRNYPKIKYTRGLSEDDFLSAKLNGEIQAKYAKEVFENNNKDLELTSQVDYIESYFDFSNIEVDAKFTHGKKYQFTGESAIGVSMLFGTKEGPGISKEVGSAFLLLVKAVYSKDTAKALFNRELKKKLDKNAQAQGNKVIFANAVKGTILGSKVKDLSIPDFVDEMMPVLKKMDGNGVLDVQPWSPQILPLQVFIIDSLAIIGVPAEFTTIAGRRLKDTALEILSKRGVKEIVLSCYTNSYSGYVTTKEEYSLQLYEGGATHFGKWTLAAYQTKIEYLAKQLLKPIEDRVVNETKPYTFSKEYLEKLAVSNYI